MTTTCSHVVSLFPVDAIHTHTELAPRLMTRAANLDERVNSARSDFVRWGCVLPAGGFVCDAGAPLVLHAAEPAPTVLLSA